jgi:hypothetical protein
VDATARRKEWLAHLEALYERVEANLAKYISRGYIEVEYETLEINEEILEVYEARPMARSPVLRLHI